MSTINVLILGDIVGHPGRQVCRELLPDIQEREKIDFTIANGENIAGGSGVTDATIEEILQVGVDVVTTGDHIFKRREAFQVLKKNTSLLRPANYPLNPPGLGSNIYAVNDTVNIGIINLLGRVFLAPIDCPFLTATKIIEELRQKTKIIIIDFHAEATSEKIALGWYLDGKVSAICGTHTHVQTSDEVILPNGTAYISDIGMTGPFHSVLGRDIDAVINRFLTQMPVHFKVANEDLRLNGVIVKIDTETGLATSIKRLQEKMF